MPLNYIFKKCTEDFKFTKSQEKINHVVCDDTPSALRYIIFFEPFYFLAGDQLVVPIGVSHISS